MPKSENQKIKLLRLYEYLRMDSDEEHPRSMDEIIKELDSQNIKCERKSIYSDIKILNDYGYGIKRKGYKYYLAKRELNLGQIRFLIDATQAANFLPVKLTEEICDSLEMLAGSHQAELIHEQVVCFDKVKCDNEEVLQTVEKINRAIENDCQVSFRYFYIGFGGQREYSKKCERYFANPIGLIFHDGRYYLICYNGKYKDTNIFRIDRISDMKIEFNIPKIHSDNDEQLFHSDAKGRMTAFGVWNKNTTQVTFLVDNSLIEDIYEKFGYDIKVTHYDQNNFTFTEKVNLSSSFYGWCASYGTHVKIIAPQSVKDEFLKKLNESASLYGYELKGENK